MKYELRYMCSLKKIVFSFILIGITSIAQAQVYDELKKLIAQSFTYFPHIQELQKANDISSLQVDLVKSNKLPVVSALGSYNYINPISKFNFNGNGINIIPNNNYNFAVSAALPIYDFGRNKTLLEKAKTDLLSSTTSIDIAKAQIAAQVATVYYSIIFLKKSIAVEDSILHFLQANKSIVESRIKQGDALQIDVTNIQSNIDLEENRKIDFLNQWQKQKALMEYAVGISIDPAFHDFDFPKFSESQPEEYAKQNNLDLKLANQRMASSEMDVKFAQTNRFPQLTFVGGTGYKNGYQPNINPLIFNYALGLNLSVPIYSAGKINQTIHLAQQTYESNQLAIKTTENVLKKDLAHVQADIKSNEDRLKNSQSQVNYAREALALAESRYKRGVATHLDLLNASSNLQRILLNQIQFRYQLCIARIEQARLIGWKYWGE